MSLRTATSRDTAFEIILAEERAKGWTPEGGAGVADFVSTPPGGGAPDLVEVREWGAPLMNPNGELTHRLQITPDQYETAMTNPTYRIEIVANLDRYLRGGAGYERLTITAAYIRGHAVPLAYEVALHELGDEVRHVDRSREYVDKALGSIIADLRLGDSTSG
ncbi:MAG: hypothetical protein M3310_08550 [Actinomycetota bacterium]|nr:hypothetical protein [Actinomycetota bacterium]